MPLYDYGCRECEAEWENMNFVAHRNDEVCPECGCPTTYIRLGVIRKQIQFPEGVWEHLGPEPLEINSKRQLREEVKKRGEDEFTACYAKYDDGYGGY